MTYQRRATVLMVVGSLLLFPASLFNLVQDGVLAITPLSIVGCVVLIVGLVKRAGLWVRLTFRQHGLT